MKLTPIRDVITDKISGEWGDEAIDGKGVVVIRTANFLNSGKINFSNLVRREINQKKVAKKRLLSGDIIIEKSGGSPTQPVGRVVIFQSPDDDTYLCNNFTSILRPKKNEVHPEYLFYVLHENHKKGKTLRHQNKTTGIINLKLDSYLDSKIPLPPIDDQIRIAHLLGKVEGLIAQRKQHLQQLDELLKSVFLEMFGDPVRNEEGWDFTSIGDSVEIQSGQVDPRELPYSELPHVGGANIESESGNLIGLKQAKYESLISGKYLFDSSHILYSKIRPYLNKVAKPDFQGICSADIYPIKPINGLLNRDFLRMLFMSKAFLNYTANNSDRANIPKINRKALVVFGFNRPPIDLQNQFAVIVEKVEIIKSSYQKSLSELENLYGALSQKAFKGELDLSRVPLPDDQLSTVQDLAYSPSPEASAMPTPQPKNTPSVLADITDIAALGTISGRQTAITQWLETYLDQVGDDASFSLEHFMVLVNDKLQALEPEQESEIPPMGIADYDQVKDWVFAALAAGKLTQGFDDNQNSVALAQNLSDRGVFHKP